MQPSRLLANSPWYRKLTRRKRESLNYHIFRVHQVGDIVKGHEVIQTPPAAEPCPSPRRSRSPDYDYSTSAGAIRCSRSRCSRLGGGRPLLRGGRLCPVYVPFGEYAACPVYMFFGEFSACSGLAPFGEGRFDRVRVDTPVVIVEGDVFDDRRRGLATTRIPPHHAARDRGD